MANLLAKKPHYVRCIKPNEKKTPNQFDPKMVLHQVRYLGFNLIFFFLKNLILIESFFL